MVDLVSRAENTPRPNPSAFLGEKDSVVIIELISNRTIVGKIFDRDNNVVWVAKPFFFVTEPIGGDQYKMNLIPFMAPGALLPRGSNLAIKTIHIAYEYEPIPQVQDAYMQVTTGLQIAKEIPKSLPKGKIGLV